MEISSERSIHRQNSAHGSETTSISPPEDYNPLLESGSFGSGSLDSYDLDNEEITDSDSVDFQPYGTTPPYDSRVARVKTRVGKREKLRNKEDSSKNLHHKSLPTENYRNHPRSAARQILPVNTTYSISILHSSSFIFTSFYTATLNN